MTSNVAYGQVRFASFQNRRSLERKRICIGDVKDISASKCVVYELAARLSRCLCQDVEDPNGGMD